MVKLTPPEMRTASGISTGINSLIAVANKHDRFKLLEDDSLPAANLDNPIHPILKWFDTDRSMRQMLLLASQYLAHDSVLTFFVPLIYGRELPMTVSGVRKTYLSNPLIKASVTRRQELLDGAREALFCLAHSMQFGWMKTDKRVYARTMSTSSRPVHGPSCCTAFQWKVTPRIEVNDRFKHYYADKKGYLAASRCAQFRSDFLLASTIVHELIHAVGVLRRSHTHEEYIRCDHPDTEWGYAWEHFMFGFIINPQNREQPGTNLLMKKVWADSKIAEKAGGKEYSTVPMAYIAQWFRQETWDIVAKQGPLAIPPPTSHFKIQSSRRMGGWILTTDSPDIKPDIIILKRLWEQEKARQESLGAQTTTFIKIFWRQAKAEKMNTHNVAIPPRDPRGRSAYGLKPRANKVTCTTVTETVKRLTTVRHKVLSHAPEVSRKRHAEVVNESVRAAKIAKR